MTPVSLMRTPIAAPGLMARSMTAGAAVPVAMSPMSRMFEFLETSYQPGFLALSKIIANIIPRVAFTRSTNERQEVLFNEVVQGSTLFAALPVTSWIGDRVQSWLSGIPRRILTQENGKAIAEALEKGGETLANRIKVAKLGKSIGASAFIAALLIATTYLRNYRTIQRTGFSDYKKVVGLGANAQPTERDKREAEAALRKNANIMKGLVIGGVTAWLGIMAIAGLIARRGLGLLQPGKLLNPSRLDAMMKHWSFVGKHSNQINGPFRSQWQALVVWGIPSYLGWFLGCRDTYEVIEQTSKFLTFLGGYFWTPQLVKNFMMRRNATLLKEAARFGELSYGNIVRHISPEHPELAQRLLAHKNTQWGLLSALNFLFAGALPVLFNIGFSRWRYQREQAAAPITPTFAAQGGPPLRRRSFEEWTSSPRRA